MRKRVENNDATQEVSSSQLVPDQKLTYPVVNKNDASMWMSQPVSADDFMQQPAKKPIAPKSNNWIVGVSAAFVVAAIAGGVWYGVLRDKPKQTAPAAAAPAATPAATGSGSAPAPTPTQPAVATTTADAAVAQPTPAAAAPSGVLMVDAISAADPAAKKSPTKKRPATKKKTDRKSTRLNSSH